MGSCTYQAELKKKNRNAKKPKSTTENSKSTILSNSRTHRTTKTVAKFKLLQNYRFQFVSKVKEALKPQTGKTTSLFRFYIMKNAKFLNGCSQMKFEAKLEAVVMGVSLV